MGFSYAKDDQPIMCFNAAKSWQLGWYADKSVTAFPLSSDWSGRMMGLADYRSSARYTVLLKLETGQDTDFYLGFNRKTGVNSGTLESADKVLVIAQGRNGNIGYSDSKTMATLSSGQTHTIDNFGDSGRSVVIDVKTINLSTSPGYADITVETSGGPREPPPTPRPTPNPTPRPTPSPTPQQQSQIRTLETTMNDNNGQAGVMFNVKAIQNLEIKGFEIHSRVRGYIKAEIYTKSGTYQGFEQSRNVWKRIQITVVSSKGIGQVTSLPLLSLPVYMARGAVQAFYVTLDTNNMRYTTGSRPGILYASDGNLQYFEGSGVVYPFGSTYTPRIFNGGIKYKLLSSASSAVEETSQAPTVSLEPSSGPSNEVVMTLTPSSDPSLEPSSSESSDEPSSA